MNNRINLVFEGNLFQKILIKSIIRTCINETLKAEGIAVPCEINVLVTNDEGIQTINKASRNIDKPTDVLSFPMFNLTAGAPPQDWGEYIDPGTGLCPVYLPGAGSGPGEGVRPLHQAGGGLSHHPFHASSAGL